MDYPNDINKFNKMFAYLEVPLDRDVAMGIRQNSPEELPEWKSIKELKQMNYIKRRRITLEGKRNN